jgi:hypothetical protein
MDPYGTTELIAAAASVAVAARFVYLGLPRQFPSLFGWLALLGVIDLTFGLLKATSTLYFWCYVVLESLKSILGIVAVRELFALTFGKYPGIRSVGRWAMYTAVSLAVGVSFLVTGFFWGGGPRGRSADLFYLEISQRSVVFTLAFVIVTILVFLSKYPLRLSRNTMVSSVLFSVLFLSEASQLLADSLAPRLFNLYVDCTYSILVAVCLLGWAALLRPESARAPERITFSTPREDHLLQQLDALNQMMTRAARR